MDILLDKQKDEGEEFYADSAYRGEEQEKIIRDQGLINRVSERAYRNKPLTEEQKNNNREKSRIRSRVEHIFGFMENSMNRMYLHHIGLKRITGIVGLMNLTYNLFRKIQLDVL